MKAMRLDDRQAADQGRRPESARMKKEARMLEETEVERLAQVLDEALASRRELAPLEQTRGPFPLGDAYRIQRACIGKRAQRGERRLGFKLGFTSEAKRKQMSLHDPIYGELTDAMRLDDGAKLEVAAGIHPKIEPEIFFVTARELRGQISLDEAQGAVAQVGAALEVLDSRYAGFKYFSLPDVVADNCSSWRFALSARTRGARELPLDRLRMALFIDGREHERADSSAISGNPLLSLVQLCAMLAAHDRALPAGSIVLAGAATAAVALRPGMDVRLEVEQLFPVSLRAA
jgi:2-oxo-3-hexenedioate decarboxylase